MFYKLTRNTLFILMSCLLVGLLSGCGDDQPQKDIESASKMTEESAYNSDVVRTQYANTPFTIVDIAERNIDGQYALAIIFSVPIDPKSDFSPFISLAKKSGKLIEGGWVISQNGRTIYFKDIEPEQTYTVNVYEGLIAGNNKKLETTVSKNITTRAVNPLVAFTDNGFVLPATLNKGLPIITLNVDEVDIDFHRVKSDKYAKFLSLWGQYQSKSSYTLQQLEPYSDLVHAGRFSLNPEKNVRTKLNIPVGEIAAIQEPGLYYVVMKSAGTYPYVYQTTYFVISDIGLHVRQYKDKINVHVSSLESTKALTEVKLLLLDKDNKTIEESKSSPDGLATFNNDAQDARVLVAQKGKHLSILHLKSSALDLSEFDLGGRISKPMEPFIYGPRDLYRPGESVIFSALLRDDDGKMLQPIPLKAKVKRPDGQLVKAFTWHPEKKLGYYGYELYLASDAPTGRWTLEVETADAQIHRYYFKVEEFLPERMKLEFPDSANKQFVGPEKDISISVLGAYLYGASAAGNRLGSIVSVQQSRHPIESLPDFEFGDIDEIEYVKRYELDDIQLNEDGEGNITIPNNWQDTKSPLDVRVIASLYESGGRPIIRTTSTTVWPDEALVGVRGVYSDDGNPSVNSNVEFEVVKAKSDGSFMAANDLEVTLIHEKKDYHWEYSEGRGWYIAYVDEHYPVYSEVINIQEGEKAKISVPVKSGSYRLEINDPETGLLTSKRFYAGYYWGDDNQQVARPDKVKLQLDKAKYLPGETAILDIISPHAGQGFILVESDEPLWFKRIDVAAEGSTVEIPVKDIWNRHDIYISVVVLRPGSNVEKVTPNRAMGLLHLPLDRERRRFNVAIDIPEKIKPNTTVTANLTVTNTSGELLPDYMMATIAAVDVGVLNITNFVTPNPFEWFFEPRRYAIDSRDLYNNVIESLEGGIAKQRFGGDAELTRGGQQPVTDVQIVSLFKKPIALSWDGKGSVDLDIPDFNGRLRFMAVAFSEDMYGSAEEEMTVVAPVVAEIAMPRFLSMGDESSISLDVHNLSGKQQKFSVNIIADEQIEMEEVLEAIELDIDERKTIVAPIKATNLLGDGRIDVMITNSAEDEDAINVQKQWYLSVRPPYPAVTQTKRKVLKKGETVSLNSTDIKNLYANTVEATIALDNKPPINLQSHMDYLLLYPYGCLEQTSSRLYPLLYASEENLTKLGIKLDNQKIKNNIERLKQIHFGIIGIIAKQKHNGGYGLWGKDTPEEHWLTAYVGDLLLDAREQGIEVPDEILDATLNRLLNYIESNNPLFGERWSDEPKHYTLSYKAYAAYVLARVNRAPLGSLRNLYDHYHKHAKSSLPLIHMGLALKMQGDNKRSQEALQKGVQFEFGERQYLGDYGSPIRDLAQTVRLFSKHDITSIEGMDEFDIGQLLYQLSDQLVEARWLSTQERNSLFLAGVETLKPSEKWEGLLLLNATKNKSQQIQELFNVTKPVTKKFDGNDVVNGIKFTSNNDKQLYSQISIVGYTIKPPLPIADELVITRSYYDLEGKSVTPDKLQMGDLLLVHLSIQSDKRIPDGLVVDLLPAGLELENQNLENSIKLSDFHVDGKSIEQLRMGTQVNTEEYRDDRYVAAVSMHEHTTSHLFYIVRAVTPGTYQVPPSYVEDMYRPYLRGIGETIDKITVLQYQKKASNEEGAEQ